MHVLQHIVRPLALEGAAPNGPRIVPAVVLFADIVGFTRLCEDMQPIEAIALLDAFRRRMTCTVARYGAAIDDCIGDAVMAVWRATAHDRDNVARALACAFAMLDEVGRWNRERTRRGLVPVRIGIGLHLGDVVIGRTGNRRRRKRVVLGDAVNVANRLERLTRAYEAELIVSDDLVCAAAAIVPWDEIQNRFDGPVDVDLRGRRHPVAVRIARMKTSSVTRYLEAERPALAPSCRRADSAGL